MATSWMRQAWEQGPLLITAWATIMTLTLYVRYGDLFAYAAPPMLLVVGFGRNSIMNEELLERFSLIRDRSQEIRRFL